MAKKVKEDCGCEKKEEKTEQIKGGAVKTKKANSWLEHVKKYRAEHPDTPYKDCLKGARKTYKKGGSVKEETHEVEPDAEPAPVKKMKKVKKVKKVKIME